MDWPFISEVLGVVGAVGLFAWGIIKSLLIFSFNQKQKLEKVKDSYVKLQIEELKAVTKSFQITLQNVREEIIKLTEKIKTNQEAQKSVMEALKDFAKNTDQRLKMFESSVTQLGNEVIVLKSKTKGRN